MCIGVIICKLAKHKSGTFRGYIAMLAVDKSFRRQNIGQTVIRFFLIPAGVQLVKLALRKMVEEDADEVCRHTYPPHL